MKKNFLKNLWRKTFLDRKLIAKIWIKCCVLDQTLILTINCFMNFVFKIYMKIDSKFLFAILLPEYNVLLIWHVVVFNFPGEETRVQIGVHLPCTNWGGKGGLVANQPHPPSSISHWEVGGSGLTEERVALLEQGTKGNSYLVFKSLFKRGRAKLNPLKLCLAQ